MKKVNKLFLFMILVLLCCFLTIWTFNHIDAWIGIIFGILVVIATVNAFMGLFINKEKQDKK